MIKIILLFAAFVAVAKAQWPLVAADNTSDILFVRNYFNQITIAQNASGFVSVLDCSPVTTEGDPCVRTSIISIPRVPTFGSVVGYNGESLISGTNDGRIYTFACDPLICVQAATLNVYGNGVPTSIIVDQVLGIFYVTYNNYNMTGPAVVVIDCTQDIFSCIWVQTLDSFVQDCISVEPMDYCFEGTLTGPISASVSLGLLFVGFPTMQNGRGIGLYYGCYPECVVQNMLYNEYDYDYSEYQVGESFTSSLSSTLYDTYQVSAFAGVSHAVTTAYYNSMTNFYTGGGYAYNCAGTPSGSSINWVCTWYYTLRFNNEFYSNCELLDQNFGVTSFMYNSYVYVGGTSACSGQGYVTYLDCNSFDSCYNLYEFQLDIPYYGDGYGAALYGDYKLFVSNSIATGIIDINPDWPISNDVNNDANINIDKHDNKLTSKYPKNIARSIEKRNAVIKMVENRVSPPLISYDPIPNIEIYKKQIPRKNHDNRKVHIGNKHIHHPDWLVEKEKKITF